MSDPIQIGPHLFTPEALQTALEQTEALPEGKKGALIATFDTTGARVALRAKISDHVELDVFGIWKPGTKDIAGGAKVMASW